LEPLVSDQNRYRRFLLGTLPEAERQALEDRFVEDKELFASLSAAEDELVEEYARGELAPDERILFEKRLLSVPGIRRRAELLRMLRVRLERTEPDLIIGTKRTLLFQNFWRFAAVAGAIVLLAGVAWWWFRGRSGDSPSGPRTVTAGVNQLPTLPPSAPGPTYPPEPVPTGGTKPIPRTNENTAPPPVQPTIATLVLLGGMTRGGGGTTVLELAPQTDAVRIELTLETNDHQQYRATLYDENSRQIWRSGPIEARGSAIAISLPGRLLHAGDYRIKLEGSADGQYLNVDNYTFRVRKLDH
jgi:hypothetical protein